MVATYIVMTSCTFAICFCLILIAHRLDSFFVPLHRISNATEVIEHWAHMEHQAKQEKRDEWRKHQREE